MLAIIMTFISIIFHGSMIPNQNKRHSSCHIQGYLLSVLVILPLLLPPLSHAPLTDRYSHGPCFPLVLTETCDSLTHSRDGLWFIPISQNTNPEASRLCFQKVLEQTDESVLFNPMLIAIFTYSEFCNNDNCLKENSTTRRIFFQRKSKLLLCAKAVVMQMHNRVRRVWCSEFPLIYFFP